MGDSLTQLQDAVDQVSPRQGPLNSLYPAVNAFDQLAQQFVASLHFVHRRHNLETLSADDKVRDAKQDQALNEGMYAIGVGTPEHVSAPILTHAHS